MTAEECLEELNKKVYEFNMLTLTDYDPEEWRLLFIQENKILLTILAKYKAEDNK